LKWLLKNTCILILYTQKSYISPTTATTSLKTSNVANQKRPFKGALKSEFTFSLFFEHSEINIVFLNKKSILNFGLKFDLHSTKFDLLF
jgi:hypothetical protein